MYCSIVLYKNGIPTAITIKKSDQSLTFKVGDNEFAIPIVNISRVLDFFK